MTGSFFTRYKTTLKLYTACFGLVCIGTVAQSRFTELQTNRLLQEYSAHNNKKCFKCGKSNNFIADIAEKVMDSVVNIQAFKNAEGVVSNTSSGSGVIIDTDGSILTNAHVISGFKDETIIITTSDKKEYYASVHSLDMLSDLAIIKLKSAKDPEEAYDLTKKKWNPATMGSNSHLRPGDWAVAIGSPLGLHHTVTVGVVSSRSRKSIEIGGIDSPVEFIQTDCTIHSGSSGGPLINSEGEVIGIITTKAEEGEGISFAIRIDNIQEILKQMMTQGKVIRPWLGVKMLTLSQSVLKQIPHNVQLPSVKRGVLISQVTTNSPAEKAGIQEGDIIVAVDKHPVSTTQEVLKRIGLRVGQPINLTITRNVPLEQDWDGRITRYEQEDQVLVVVPSDLNILIH